MQSSWMEAGGTGFTELQAVQIGTRVGSAPWGRLVRLHIRTGALAACFLQLVSACGGGLS